MFRRLSGTIEAAIGGENSIAAAPEPTSTTVIAGREHNASRPV
jgi:hypothetical protein